jgi:hypothetical protein
VERVANEDGVALDWKAAVSWTGCKSCDEEGYRNYCNLLLDGFEIRVFLNDAEQIEYTAANPEEGWVRVIPTRSILKGFVEIRIKQTSRSWRT